MLKIKMLLHLVQIQVMWLLMTINLKNLKVAPKNHPIYTGKYQTYSVSSNQGLKKSIKNTKQNTVGQDNKENKKS